MMMMMMSSMKKSDKDCGSSCSMTPSENSIPEEDENGSDSDYESDHGEDRFDHLGKLMNIRWIGPGRTIPILVFDSQRFFNEDPELKNVGLQCNLACKVAGDSQILRDILSSHGFREVGLLHRRYNLAWTGRHTKPSYVKRMANYHVINHFPRTEELTRKDKLYSNVIKMQRSKGKEHFHFVPVSFKMPSQYRSLRSHYKKEKGLYIVKPVSLSRGRGVFVVDNPKKINSVHIEGCGDSRHETRHRNIVSKYIPNPLIINGYKFDLRIYVTVTSFDPIVIYMYSEGLTRFATVRYDLSLHDLDDRCMHLTNYSINSESDKYIRNVDSMVENEGSKWSLGALLRYFKAQGKDTSAIMDGIEDIVIKTVLSVEWKIGAACKRYVHHRHNCFELFGFDILLDENYKPWLIEVNLSPSLGCDTPLDVKVKGNMLCDLLNLVGVRCYDPHMQNLPASDRRTVLTLLRNRLKNSYGHYYYRICRDACHRAWGLQHSRRRLKMMLNLENNWSSNNMSQTSKNKAMEMLATLRSDEIEIIQKVKDEEARRHNWVRVFPKSDSWDRYQKFMDFPSTNNLMLHQRLYPERHKVMTAGRSPKAASVTPSPSVNELIFQMTGKKACNQRVDRSYVESLQRLQEYETPLQNVPPSAFYSRHDSEFSDSSMLPPWTRSVAVSTDGLESAYMTARRKFEDRMGDLDPCDMDYCSYRPSSDQSYLPHRSSNILDLLDIGYTLTEVQARVAFTVYLLQFLNRLLLCQEKTDRICHVMKLVRRFLKQSFKYLITPPPKVELPGEFLGWNNQRALLAKSLANFISSYMEETDIRRSAIAETVLMVGGGDMHVEDHKFEQYLYHNATEKDLEKMLKDYSKRHDPVVTFLGKRCRETFNGLSYRMLNEGGGDSRIS